MINPETPDSQPLTFEERIEKIQNMEVIPKFVEKFKIGRSEIQIWGNYELETSTSSSNNLNDQGASTSSVSYTTKLTPSGHLGYYVNVQGSSTPLENNLNDQRPSTSAGNNLNDQGPSTSAGNNRNDQGPSTSSIIDLKNEGPSNSAGNNLKTARHHAIPGDILRNSFFHMLSTQNTWPYMVQVLHAALENLRHHKSSTKIDGKFIDDAQEALDLFDARIEKCNFNFDSETFEKALEYLLTVFYWSPFNIYYGPLPFMRAPADVGNKLDKDLFPGINIVITESLRVLEDQLKNSVISELTVKLYITNLFFHPKPKLAGSYRKVTLSFDDFLKDCLIETLKTSFTADELNQMVVEIKKDQFFSQNEISLLSHLKDEWISKLEVGGACNRCMTYAKESLIREVENYKCKSKKCPIYSAQPKYALYSHVNDNTAEVAKKIFQGTSQYYSTLDSNKGAYSISEDLTNIISCGHEFEYSMSQPECAFSFIINANLITDNFDREYMRLKNIRMRNKPVTLAEIYSPYLPMRIGPNFTKDLGTISMALRIASLPHDKMVQPFWHPS